MINVGKCGCNKPQQHIFSESRIYNYGKLKMSHQKMFISTRTNFAWRLTFGRKNRFGMRDERRPFWLKVLLSTSQWTNQICCLIGLLMQDALLVIDISNSMASSTASGICIIESESSTKLEKCSSSCQIALEHWWEVCCSIFQPTLWCQLTDLEVQQAAKSTLHAHFTGQLYHTSEIELWGCCVSSKSKSEHKRLRYPFTTKSLFAHLLVAFLNAPFHALSFQRNHPRTIVKIDTAGNATQKPHCLSCYCRKKLFYFQIGFRMCEETKPFSYFLHHTSNGNRRSFQTQKFVVFCLLSFILIAKNKRSYS